MHGGEMSGQTSASWLRPLTAKIWVDVARPRKLGSCRKPSGTMAIGDADADAATMKDYFLTSNYEDGEDTTSGYLEYLATCHNKQSNLVFADGHYEPLSRKEITNEKCVGFLK